MFGTKGTLNASGRRGFKTPGPSLLSKKRDQETPEDLESEPASYAPPQLARVVQLLRISPLLWGCGVRPHGAVKIKSAWKGLSITCRTSRSGVGHKRDSPFAHLHTRTHTHTLPPRLKVGAECRRLVGKLQTVPPLPGVQGALLCLGGNATLWGGEGDTHQTWAISRRWGPRSCPRPEAPPGDVLLQGAPLRLGSGASVGAPLSWSPQGKGSWSRRWQGQQGALIPVGTRASQALALPCPALLHTPRPAAHGTLTLWVPSWSQGSPGPPTLAFPGQRAASGFRVW